MNHTRPCSPDHTHHDTKAAAAIVRIAAEAILAATGRDTEKALRLLPELRHHLRARLKHRTAQ